MEINHTNRDFDKLKLLRTIYVKFTSRRSWLDTSNLLQEMEFCDSDSGSKFYISIDTHSYHEPGKVTRPDGVRMRFFVDRSLPSSIGSDVSKDVIKEVKRLKDYLDRSWDKFYDLKVASKHHLLTSEGRLDGIEYVNGEVYYTYKGEKLSIKDVMTKILSDASTRYIYEESDRNKFLDKVRSTFN